MVVEGGRWPKCSAPHVVDSNVTGVTEPTAERPRKRRRIWIAVVVVGLVLVLGGVVLLGVVVMLVVVML